MKPNARKSEESKAWLYPAPCAIQFNELIMSRYEGEETATTYQYEPTSS